jgi:hypothetical protein
MRKNLPSMDYTNDEVLKSAMSAEKGGGVSGKYIAAIKENIITESANGSVFIELVFEMPNGKTYRQERKHIAYPDGKEGFYVPMLRSLFAVTGQKDKLGTIKHKTIDFVDGEAVETEEKADSYVELNGKKVGVVLYHYQRYPDRLGINGYTGVPIPKKMEDEEGYNQTKDNPATIWMPNYESEPKPVFEFVQFFDPQSGKTLSELQNDNCTTPQAADKTAEKIIARNHKATKLVGKAWDELRIKRLKKNLKRYGETFNKDEFVPSPEAEGDDISAMEAIEDIV